jgi:phosphotransferase system enzyme I (PtsI)
MTVLTGKGVHRGVAFGTVFLLKQSDISLQTPAGTAEQELARFEAAKDEADTQLEALFDKTSRELGEDEGEIIDVQRMMLADGDFTGTIKMLIEEKFYPAQRAVDEAGKKFSSFFSSSSDVYIKARALDVADITSRLLNILLQRNISYAFPGPSIVVANDLMPSQLLQMEKTKLRAVVTRNGSENSHTSILARAMDIPCIIQSAIPQSSEIDAVEIIADGEEGVCYLEPDEKTVSKMRKKQAALKLAHTEMITSMKGLPTETKSGKVVRLLSNINTAEDIELALANDSKGIGLFRSEYQYINRDDYPEEDELFQTYRLLAEAMGDKPVIIRTIDIGSEKNVKYLNIDKEDNPALGLRGTRISLDNPEVLRTQLRAIYRASIYGNISIKFPMITALWEVRHCKEIAASICQELAGQGLECKKIPIGIMIETPAAAMISDSLANEVDFFSVGTNDLTQYTLAIDRRNSNLEKYYDPMHPAVMEMLRIIINSAKRNGIWAGICGELAAKPEATAALIDMGYDTLSVSPILTLDLRKRIRELE